MKNTELPAEQRRMEIIEVVANTAQRGSSRYVDQIVAGVIEVVANTAQRGSSRYVDQIVADVGTRISARSDLRSVLVATMPTATRVEFDTPPSPAVPATRMARIRELADLSLRDWATVFGVTHTSIKQWLSTEPDRAKVGQVLQALEEAAHYQPNLRTWLRRGLPGTDVTPLDLLRRDSWRAFRGALRSRPAPPVGTSGDELRRRRQRDESWAVPEAPADGDE